VRAGTYLPKRLDEAKITARACKPGTRLICGLGYVNGWLSLLKVVTELKMLLDWK
jgi:hypothetical protein